MSLAGKVALVTGASRSIGRATAQALAQEGIRVAVGFHEDKDGALEAAAACGDAITVQIDVTQPESVASAFDEVEASLGEVGVLVNNAGLRKDRLLLRMKEEDWGEVIDADLTGVYRCTKRAIPGMLKACWGRVVSVGSVVGQVGNPGQANYAAAKAGLVGFTKSLAREVARHGITANVVAPGFVESALTANLSEAARKALLGRIAMERPAGPEEIAEAIRFCVRASYLTGQVITIDGGLT
ncbi:MAG: 3-oxoacyl-ACP reductase family protein [Actinomycetota bacterium]